MGLRKTAALSVLATCSLKSLGSHLVIRTIAYPRRPLAWIRQLPGPSGSQSALKPCSPPRSQVRRPTAPARLTSVAQLACRATRLRLAPSPRDDSQTPPSSPPWRAPEPPRSAPMSRPSAGSAEFVAPARCPVPRAGLVAQRRGCPAPGRPPPAPRATPPRLVATPLRCRPSAPPVAPPDSCRRTSAPRAPARPRPTPADNRHTPDTSSNDAPAACADVGLSVPLRDRGPAPHARRRGPLCLASNAPPVPG